MVPGLSCLRLDLDMAGHGSDMGVEKLLRDRIVRQPNAPPLADPEGKIDAALDGVAIDVR
jgi:hypothetical protein